MPHRAGSYYTWLVQAGMTFHEPILELSSGECNTLSTKFVDVARAQEFRKKCTIEMQPASHKDKWVLFKVTTEKVESSQ